jgi:hypothetical protein
MALVPALPPANTKPTGLQFKAPTFLLLTKLYRWRCMNPVCRRDNDHVALESPREYIKLGAGSHLQVSLWYGQRCQKCEYQGGAR